MSDPANAVFLSYASQDADAARRICEALRAAGVEVWFDQNELVGGDAWDAKIRKQIAECALFVPIISATTQARHEGYFRLEWKLAAQRTHMMSGAKAFLLPVVIDSTRDAEAHVPAEFQAVQWTRLPPDARPEAFATRVHALLHGNTAPAPAALRAPGNDAAPSRTRPMLRRRAVALTGALALSAIGLVALWRPWRKSIPPNAAVGEARSSSEPVTEAQKLIAQARHVLDSGDELNRESYFFAEDLVKRAVQLDPAEPAAWTLHARLSYLLIWHNIDMTETRREAMRRQAERARALAPASSEVQIVSADVKVQLREELPEVEQALNALIAREPGNWHAYRSLGTLCRFSGRPEEAIRTYQRAVELSGGSAVAEGDLVNALMRGGRQVDAEVAVARALARHRGGRLLCFSQFLQAQWRGDLASARAALATWPDWLRVEDRGAILSWRTLLWSKRYDEALAVTQRLQRDYLRDTYFMGPRAVLSALTHEGAGHEEAARADWRIALQLAERELAAVPMDIAASFWKAWALARLGDVTGAQAMCAQLQQRNQLALPEGPRAAANRARTANYFGSPAAPALWAAVGRPDLVLAELRRMKAANFFATDFFPLSRAMLELDPAFASLRGDPEFKEIMAAAPGPAAAPAAEPKSIAVLPFENRSDDKANAFFTDGVHDDILTSLTNIRDLHVISRTSVLAYRGTTKSVPQIARELGVAYVLGGSVQRSGNSVRITGQLIRGANDQHVWAKNFDRELTAANVFAIQTDLAQAIAIELKAVLSPGEQKLIARLPTGSIEAYDAFLKARDLRERLNTFESRREVVTLLERAVAIDPRFGLAWAKLAWARVYVSGGSASAAERLAGAREAIVQAEKLIPDAPELFLSRGWCYYFGEYNYDRALAEFERARQMSPNFAEPRYAMASVQRRQGRWLEALAGFQAAAQIEPANPEHVQEIGTLLLAGRRYAEAEAALRRAAELGRTGSSLASVRATLALHARGELPPASASSDYDSLFQTLLQGIRPDAAKGAALSPLEQALALAVKGDRPAARALLAEPIQWLGQTLEKDTDDDRSWSLLAKMEALRGDREAALRAARRSLALPYSKNDAWAGANQLATLAWVHTWTGDVPAACEEFARLLQTPVYPTGGFVNVHVLRLHPATAPLRGHPRFEALLNDPKNNAPLF